MQPLRPTMHRHDADTGSIDFKVDPRLWPWSAVAIACTLSLFGCASIDHTKGMVQIGMDKPEEGVQSLGSAAKRAPTDPGYKIDYLLNREEQARELAKQGDALRSEGKIAQARDFYERTLKLDPSDGRALAGLNALAQDARYEKSLTDGEAFLAQMKWDLAMDRANQVLDDFPKNKRALALKSAVADAKFEADAAIAKERASRSILDAMVTLQFSDASLKSVFEALSKSTGLNILFDRDVKQDSKATIFVKDVSVSDAVDLILMQNQLQKRVVNGNTMMIYPANAAKMAEYEDLTIRTFQITNADIKYVANMLKTMLKLKDMSADEKTGILVIRDTPETLRMAERLITAHDVPDPEIMLEVEVLEVSKKRDSNIGIKPPNAITISTPGAAGSLTLGALERLSKDDLIVSNLSTTLNFKLDDSDAKILASPRIRARNKETAKIMIGDRVPTITNTVTPVNTGAAVVTGNVTYQDVGLKLEFEPQVYANNEVGIKIALEVSNIVQEFTDNNGSRSYQIGTRNATTNLRLKDGETQILGGLITNEDRNAASKIPGLGHLPVIGRLFGNNAGTDNRSEIVLAITPRIVRNLAVRAPDVKAIFSGTYNGIREKPILADPISKLKVGGTFGGAEGSAAATPSGAILINPQSSPTAAPQASKFGSPPTPAQPAKSGFGSSNSGYGSPATPPPLPMPPPMFVRPPGAN